MTESADLTLNTLHTLHSLVEQNAELIAPYADTLIPRLLTLSVYKPKMVKKSLLIYKAFSYTLTFILRVHSWWGGGVDG